jgi:hypothetical protein
MNKIITISQPSPESKPYLAIKLSILQERLRQARCSFNLAVIATGISFSITLVGAGCLIMNQASEGTVTTAVGLLASVGYIRMAKDANNRLDKILAELDEKV